MTPNHDETIPAGDARPGGPDNPRPQPDATLPVGQVPVRPDSGEGEPPRPTPPDRGAASDPPSNLPSQIGPYRVLGKLGEGGMGIVYEAEQQSPRRRVALKVIRGGQFVDAERVRMFQREVDTLARLKHPNIGAIYDAGRTESSQHFFAMELVRGLDLDVFLSERGPAEGDELRFRLELFRSICDAVHYAHQRGVIHRDLKPSNIVVVEEAEAETAGTPTVKILDFGLARITEGDVAVSAVTEIGVIKGTLAYMSPEQTRGEPGDIDIRSDVYSLGVILYEMLAGRRPYDIGDKTLLEAVRVISEQAPETLRRSLSGMRRPDADLETIVGKALEKDADRRYSSAASLSEDVARFLDSRPILARPPSTIYQIRKFARRHRTVVLGAAATVAVLIAGVVASTTFGLRESAQRRAAETARQETEAVVEFQEQMLSEVDAALMGRRLADDLRGNLETALRDRGASDAEVSDALASFGSRLDAINTTNLALGVIDENVLGRALTAAEREFADQPAIRARLFNSIGATYFSLGMLDRAEQALVASRAVYDSLLGPGSLPGAEAEVYLAMVYTYQGRFEEAEPLNRSALAVRRRALGEDHADVLQVMNDLAMMLTDAGQTAEADSLYRVTLEKQRRMFGEEDRGTITTMGNYAWLLTDQGRFEEAEPLAVRALELKRRVFGNDHTETMISVNNLAVLYKRMGRLAEAEPLYHEDYEVSRNLLGDRHPDLLPTMSNLGRLHTAQGKFVEAEEILAKALSTAREILPRDHYGRGIITQSYGDALVGLERFAEAEEILLEAHGILVPITGEDHAGTQRCVEALVNVYDRMGRRDEARAWRSKLPKSG